MASIDELRAAYDQACAAAQKAWDLAMSAQEPGTEVPLWAAVEHAIEYRNHLAELLRERLS